MLIEHRTGSLFEAQSQPGSILAHACNAKGVWGSGIARQFKERFPDQYNAYDWYCCKKSAVVWNAGKRAYGLRGGTTLLVHDRAFDVSIACMITSEGYGKDVDSPDKILEATESAFKDLLSQIDPSRVVHMPKINSGLFNVPWADTQEVLAKVGLDFPDTHVIVWTP